MKIILVFKDQSGNDVKSMIHEVENSIQNSAKVSVSSFEKGGKWPQLDRGDEYVKTKIEECLNKNCTTSGITNLYSPKFNGLKNQLNYSFPKMDRAMVMLSQDHSFKLCVKEPWALSVICGIE